MLRNERLGQLAVAAAVSNYLIANCGTKRIDHGSAIALTHGIFWYRMCAKNLITGGRYVRNP